MRTKKFSAFYLAWKFSTATFFGINCVYLLHFSIPIFMKFSKLGWKETITIILFAISIVITIISSVKAANMSFYNMTIDNEKEETDINVHKE